MRLPAVSSFLLLGLLPLTGWGKAAAPSEKPPSLPRQARSPAPPLPPNSAAPQPQELEALIKRIFAGTVVAATGRDAITLVGDFNGDGSTDLAVAVRPLPGQLERLNDPYANWVVEEPRSIRMPDLKALTEGANPVVPRAEVAPGDLLLAIIHGYGREGWRSPLATRFLLLKNAVGQNMTVQRASQFNHTGTARRRSPSLRGALIHEVLGGQPGFIYFNGAAYAWFPLRAASPARAVSAPQPH